MEALAINGANQTYPVLPAGYATRSIAGAAGVTLASNEGAADIIELTGTITANIVVTIPIPIFNQVVGTTGPYTVALSWLKFVRNSTSGAFTVTVVGPGGTGVVVPQGEALTLYSKDGVNVQAISGAASSTSTAFGVDFVFQPGGPAPVGATNVFTTEATLVAAMTAVMNVTQGPIRLAIDSSLAAAQFALPHSWGGRVYLEPSSYVTGATLTLLDGAVQTDLRGGHGPLVLACSCTTGPALAFTGARSTFEMEETFEITNAGAFPVCVVGAGNILQVLCMNFASFFKFGAGAIFGLVATATLTSVMTAGSQNIGNANFVSGAGGAWINVHDAGFAPQVTAGFFGATTEILVDNANEVGFSQAAQPPPVLPLTAMTAQQAVDMHYSPSVTVGAGPVTVDATALNQCFKATAGALQFNIPATFPVGRELTFSDASGGAGGNAFTLAPAASEEIGAAGLGAAVTYLQVAVKTLTIKKTDATVWTVISSTTLV